MLRAADEILYRVSMLLPFAFAGFVWFSSWQLARWAKIASLIACVAEIAWNIITFFQPPLSIKRYPFLLAVSIKQILAGVVIGIFITKRSSEPRDSLRSTS